MVHLSAPHPYVVSALATAVAVLAWLLLLPLLGPLYLLPFAAAVALAAALGGLRAALVPCAAAVLAAAWAALAANGSNGFDLAWLVALASFLAVAGALTALARGVRAERAAARAESAHYARGLADAELLVREAVVDADARYRLQEECGRRLGLLLDAGREPQLPNGREAALRALAERAVAEYADWCTFELDDREREPIRVLARAACSGELARAEPNGETAIGGQLAVQPRLPRPPTSALYRDLAVRPLDGQDAPEHDSIAGLHALGLRSAIVAPLVADGERLGTVGLGRSDGSPPFEDQDLAVAEALADRASGVLERARLRAAAESGTAYRRAIFEASADALLLIDEHGRYVDANRAALELFGRARAELLAMRVGDLPILGPNWSDAGRARFTREGSWQGTMVVPHAGVPPLAVEVRVHAVLLADQTVYLAALRDLSARGTLTRVQDDLCGVLGRELQSARELLRAFAERSRRGGAVGPAPHANEHGRTPAGPTAPPVPAASAGSTGLRARSGPALAERDQ